MEFTFRETAELIQIHLQWDGGVITGSTVEEQWHSHPG